MLFSLRIALPDRPGTLGAVAAAFGRGGANIVTLDVVAREPGLAVDDLVVEAPQGLTQALLLAQEEVEGLVVEELKPLEAFPDLMSPLELAAVLAESTGSALELLVERLPEALRASWSAVVRATPGGLEVIGSSIGSPQLSGVDPSWLPITAPCRLPPAEWMPRSWRTGPGSNERRGKFELAAAPLTGTDLAVMVARRERPLFRESELKELGLLARIAAVRSAAPSGA